MHNAAKLCVKFDIFLAKILNISSRCAFHGDQHNIELKDISRLIDTFIYVYVHLRIFYQISAHELFMYVICNSVTQYPTEGTPNNASFDGLISMVLELRELLNVSPKDLK